MRKNAEKLRKNAEKCGKIAEMSIYVYLEFSLQRQMTIFNSDILHVRMISDNPCAQSGTMAGVNKGPGK